MSILLSKSTGNQGLFRLATINLWAGLSVLTAPAAAIPVPNGSFEAPATDSVELRVNNWQKTPKPFWWDDAAYGLWGQLVGAFVNTPPGTEQHIVNCDGNQAVWLFANPTAGFFQDYQAVDWAGSTQVFTNKYEPGKSYELTFGTLVGTAFPMAASSILEAALYYRDTAGERVTIASTLITNSPLVFTNATNFLTFNVRLPVVRASDPWTGQYIGISFMSLVDPAAAGGYWDIDNVRLSDRSSPLISAPVIANGSFQFQVQTEPGVKFEVLVGQAADQSGTWTSIGTWTNQTGTVLISDPVSTQPQFYRVRELSPQ